MKTATLTIAMLATILALGSAHAQTYDPRYPVCMHVFGGMMGGGDYFDCSFQSIPQCNLSASGRSAMCLVNPYFVAPSRAGARRRSRYR